MKISKESGLPSFFYHAKEDEFNKDKGKETLQDFFLSWTIHCAENKFKETNPKLHQYARRVVFALIFGNNNSEDEFIIGNEINDSFKVVSISSWYQYYYIDLLFEITIEFNSESKSYVLNIEDKWYEPLRNGQLEEYSRLIQNEYANKGNSIINLFITCDDCRKNYEEEKNVCRSNKYTFLTISDLATFAQMSSGGPTGNSLFDEFWFNT